MGVLTIQRRLWFFVVVIFLCGVWDSDHAEAEKRTKIPLVVVVAKESKLDSLSLSQLKHMYGGNNHKRNRRPFNRSPRSAERVAFDKRVLGLSPSQMGRYWIDRKVRGQNGSPRSLSNALLVAKVVRRFPGAIGYMRADQMPSWVKALKISGKTYTDPRYPLYVEVVK